MARAKKPDDKGGATLQIDVDSFVRTRDSVVTGLQTLQDAIRTLSSAYIKHTNAVLGEYGASPDFDATLANLSDIPLLGLGDNLSRTVNPSKISSSEVAPEKKERKKRHHDPNAPKRPLTPFFLYMQTARPIIAKDLGADVPKGAVGLEGQRRWQTMNEEDKQLWTDAYKDNLRLYQARIHSYKAGNANAKEMNDAEASCYAAENNITVTVLDNSADAQLVGESSATAYLEEDIEVEPEPEPEPEIEPTPPPKTPKSKTGRKQKSKPFSNETIKDNESIIPNSSAISQVASDEKEKSPERKRKRAKKIEEREEKGEQNVEIHRVSQKQRKKKSKNEQ